MKLLYIPTVYNSVILQIYQTVWVTKAIRISNDKNRQQLHRLAKTSGDQNLKVFYKQYRSILKSIAKSKFIIRCNNKITAEWPVVRIKFGASKIIQHFEKLKDDRMIARKLYSDVIVYS